MIITESNPAQITSGVMLAQAASVTPETCCMAFHNFHPGAAGWTFAPADAVNAGKCTFYSKVSESPPLTSL